MSLDLQDQEIKRLLDLQEQEKQELLDLLKTAEAKCESLSAEIAADKAWREELSKTSQSIIRSLQSPLESVLDLLFQPHHLAAVRIALDANWLDAIASAGESGISAEAIAKTNNADPALVVRTMRLLTAKHTVLELSSQVYAPTDLTHLMIRTGVRHGVSHMWNHNTSTVATLPRYFANNGYKSPDDPKYGPFAFAHGEEIWSLMAKMPERGENFDKFMTVGRMGRRSWYEAYPMQRLIEEVANADDVLLVDIGGGKGHELNDLATAHPFLSGPCLVLQDQAQVLSQVPSTWLSNFTTQPHDFFTPQPLKGARAYYFRQIFHDWPDSLCRKILTLTREAMTPGYSRILINEQILPDVGCHFLGAAVDMSMMAMHNGKERTRKEWVDLVGSVGGLRVEEFYPIEEGAEGIVDIAAV